MLPLPMLTRGLEAVDYDEPTANEGARIILGGPPPETWCPRCEMMYRTECPEHRRLLIPDDKIPRAFSTCPNTLAMKSIENG